MGGQYTSSNTGEIITIRKAINSSLCSKASDLLCRGRYRLSAWNVKVLKGGLAHRWGLGEGSMASGDPATTFSITLLTAHGCSPRRGSRGWAGPAHGTGLVP